MFRYEWRDLLLDELLTELAGYAHRTERAGARPELLLPVLVEILAGTGGLPLAGSDWPAEHRVAVAKRLLQEAVRGFLFRVAGFEQPSIGLLRRREDDGWYAHGHRRVRINQEDAGRLATLPGIGSVLAERIVQERRRNGGFTTLEELAARVHQLGRTRLAELAGVIDFSTASSPHRPQLSGNFSDDLHRLMVFTSPDPARPLLEPALETLASFLASDPHPATRLSIRRLELEPAPEVTAPDSPIAAAVQVLADRHYHARLMELFSAAESQIDVCMFFMALGGSDHPTRQLVEGLLSRAAEGFTVRVLLDRDDQGDPYGSRLINTPAARHLAANGVEVRFDRPEALMHSKFVVIDQVTTVIGSHNWTLGSFFDYRDLSLCIEGAAASRQWSERFDRLWSEGETFNPGR